MQHTNSRMWGATVSYNKDSFTLGGVTEQKYGQRHSAIATKLSSEAILS